MSSEHHEGIVIYTDGSCRPTNPGPIGWGAHGYHYTTELDSKGTGLSTQILTAQGYVPMSQKAKETNQAVKPLSYFDFFGSTNLIATNNTAEVDALYFALKELQSYAVKCIQVFTDSEYVRRGITEWAKSWERNNWIRADGSPVPNTDSWKRLLEIFNKINSEGKTVSVKWIRGHNDNFGNEHADKLSVVGCLHSINGIFKEDFKTSPSQGYWKSDVERHPFINFRRLYFNSTSEFNDPGHYYIAEPGGDAKDGDWIIGKKFPESSYAVLKLKEPDKVIETVKQKQFNISSNVNAVMLMRLDKVYNPEVYSYIDDHGHCALLPDSKNLLNVNFLDKKPVTLELNPAGLSLRAIENFGMLDELVQLYQAIQDGREGFGHYTNLQIHDITGHFFEYEEKLKKKEVVQECKLKTTFGVGFKDTMIDVHVSHRDKQHAIKIPLILGTDILPRNSLKRIETMNPKLSLLTWKEAEDTIRYACVAEVETGIGIWSNYFANRIFL